MWSATGTGGELAVGDDVLVVAEVRAGVVAAELPADIVIAVRSA
jgi:hypothetical protein